MAAGKNRGKCVTEQASSDGGIPPASRKWISKNVKIGAALSVALAAVTGFASPEVRQLLCLELPAPGDLEYAPETPGATAFSKLALSSAQAGMDGAVVRFRARWYGHAVQDAYRLLLDPHGMRDRTVANLRAPVGPAGQDPDFDPNTLPAFAAVLAPADAARLAALPNGTLVELEGTARHIPFAPDDSAYALATAIGDAKSRMPDHADFYVDVSSVGVPMPTNDPRSRVLCKAFHDLEG